MGDRTLADIVKQALTEGMNTTWIAEQCCQNELSYLVPARFLSELELRRALAERAQLDARIERIRRDLGQIADISDC